MKKLLSILAAAVLSIGLTSGAVLAQTGTLETTGPDSTNKVIFENENNVKVDNDADVKLDNKADQDADSGDAKVRKNTTGGDAWTGLAENDTSFIVDGDIDNSGVNEAVLWDDNCCDSEGHITETGPGSTNIVKFDNENRVRVDNDTKLDIKNDVDQDATSGDAEVTYNTTGGDAATGDAVNTSYTEISFTVTN